MDFKTAEFIDAARRVAAILEEDYEPPCRAIIADGYIGVVSSKTGGLIDEIFYDKEVVPDAK